MICHAGAHFYVVREKKGEKKKGLCTDWLAPQLGPQTPLLCLMGERHSLLVCVVQLHQGYFYLKLDGGSCCNFRHCTHLKGLEEERGGKKRSGLFNFPLSCGSLLCALPVRSNRSFKFVFSLQSASKIMFSAGWRAVWSSLYFYLFSS